MTQFKFSVGPWNVHTGADAYGPATRKDIPIEEKFKKFAEIGFSAIQFHDDDAVPNINDYTEEEIKEVSDALRSGWITTGPRTKQFEKNLCEYLRVDNCVCLNSATAEMKLSFLRIHILLVLLRQFIVVRQ